MKAGACGTPEKALIVNKIQLQISEKMKTRERTGIKVPRSNGIRASSPTKGAGQRVPSNPGVQ